MTFLFADVPALSRLWETDEMAAREALSVCERIVNDAILPSHGRTFKKIADGCCVVFPSAPAAVTAALAIQRRACGHLSEHGALPMRIGVHTGEVEERRGDYYGLALSKVARLRDAAHPGQVLLTQATEVLVRDDLGDGVRLIDLGLHRLRDLQRHERLYQIAHPDIPVDFPPPLTLAAFPNNLPQQLTSFIGRAEAMDRVRGLLAGTRLLSIIGGGGCGKTRLAVQLAAEVVDEYADGVWFVDLAPVSDPDLVAPTVAKVVGALEQGATPAVGLLAQYLSERACLIVLDNCEHLIVECAAVVDRLLEACPRVRVLATSRERLRISGETIWEAHPLAVPDPRRAPTAEHLLTYESVQLFEDRANLAQVGFAVTDANAAAVARICSQLDGIPLAIELAAAHVRLLAVEQLANRLGDRLRLLAGRARGSINRHETLEAAVDWSHGLLTEEEKVLFRRLASFSGGWSLEAAEYVCSDYDDGRPSGCVGGSSVLDVLTGLVDKSLVIMDVRPDGEARYRMLETVRQYAWGRLLGGEGADVCMGRHRDWFRDLCESASAQLEGPEQAVLLDRLELEYDNIRVALKWSVEADVRLRMAACLWRFWFVRGYLSEGRSWLVGTLSRAPSAPALLRARALNGLGVLARQQGDCTQALQYHRESLELRRENGDIPGTAGSLVNVGTDERHLGDLESARTRYEEGLRLYRDLRNTAGIAASLSNLGSIALEQADYDRAVPLLEESLAIHRKAGNRLGVAIALHNLGEIHVRLERWHDAGRYLVASIRVWQELGNRCAVTLSIGTLAAVSAHIGLNVRAATLLAASGAARAAVGSLAEGTELDQEEKARVHLMAQLPPEVFRAAWDRGAAMSVEEAAAYALE